MLKIVLAAYIFFENHVKIFCQDTLNRRSKEEYNLKLKSFVKSLNVTLDHKTSHKGQFFQIEMYTSPES